MFDDWEWDNYELQYANNIDTDDQKRKIHEKKLVEEADNILMKELFDNNNDNDNDDDNNKNDNDKNDNDKNDNDKNDNNVNKSICTKNNFSKKIENEVKQKDLSKKIQKQITEKNRHIEIYGEPQYLDNEYLDYEDKFYK